MDTLRYCSVPLTTLTGVVGFLLGGNYVWLGAATFPVMLVLDVLLPADTAPRRIAMPWLADLQLYLHAILMFALYGAFLAAVADGSLALTGPGSGWQVAGSFVSIVWLSSVPNLPVAHELLHRRHWFPRRVSQILMTFFADPNRDIGHVMTHHIFLDTAKDSDTPRRGETIYTFIFRATLGSYEDAIRCEAESLRRHGLSPWNWRNRNYQQVLMLLVIPGVCGYVGGMPAMVFAAAAMITSKLFLEAFNYFQHYGLVRVEGAPVLKHHTWNHLGAVVRPLGVEITNHINHHLDSHTKFYDLKPEPDAPQMPSLFLCFLLGLIPPLWFSLIAKPRLKDWDQRYATQAERKLAMAANARAGWPQWIDMTDTALSGAGRQAAT